MSFNLSYVIANKKPCRKDDWVTWDYWLNTLKLDTSRIDPDYDYTYDAINWHYDNTGVRLSGRNKKTLNTIILDYLLITQTPLIKEYDILKENFDNPPNIVPIYKKFRSRLAHQDICFDVRNHYKDTTPKQFKQNYQTTITKKDKWKNRFSTTYLKNIAAITYDLSELLNKHQFSINKFQKKLDSYYGRKIKSTKKRNRRRNFKKYGDLNFDLNKAQCYVLRLEPCHYCQDSSTLFRQIDRKNSKVGYVWGNCVPCCEICNNEKHTSTYEDFIYDCKRYAKNRNN